MEHKINIGIEQAQKVCNEMQECANKYILQDAINEIQKQSLILFDVSDSISNEKVINAIFEWLKSDDCWIEDENGNKLDNAKICGKGDISKYLS